MKPEVFLQALNDVDDKYNEEAVKNCRKKTHLRVWQGIAIAACAVLAASAVMSLIGNHLMQSPDKAARSASEEMYYEAGYENKAAGDMAEMDVVYETAAYEEAVYEEMAYEEPAYEEPAPLAVSDTFSDHAFIAEQANMASAQGVEAETAAEAEEGQTLQKIIYNVYMSIQTTTFDESSSSLEALITECGGYCENQNSSNNKGRYRDASYTVRIPAGNLETFLEGIDQIGTVSYMNRSADDVSESYYDIQSRLTSARTKLERLNELLKDAEDMEDIIALESAISDTQWEIDSYQGTLNYYDSRVSYSTVTIELQEVAEVVAEEAPMSFGERVSSAFHQGVRGFVNFFKNAAIWFSASWIWILIVAAVAAALILIIRKIRHR